MSNLLKELKNKYKEKKRNENENEGIQFSSPPPSLNSSPLKSPSLNSSLNSSSPLNFIPSQNYLNLLEKLNENKLKNKIENIENNEEKKENEVKKIGLLFIIIDDLPHELIWRLWLNLNNNNTNNNENNNKFEIFIHAKYPEKIQSKWVKKYLVDFCLLPEWGSVEITKVMIKLLRKVNVIIILININGYN